MTHVKLPHGYAGAIAEKSQLFEGMRCDTGAPIVAGVYNQSKYPKGTLSMGKVEANYTDFGTL